MNSPATPILVERRFPVGLEVSIGSIRDLYEESKTGAWDPESDIDWGALDGHQYSDEQRNAARLTWSRRAWVLYTGLAETPSMLVRFCLEREREADPKFFLTVRSTEEAWHIECCHRMAECFGGYIEAPSSVEYQSLLNQSFHREVLHADTPLDAYFVAHAMLGEGIELALWEAYLRNARDAVVQQMLLRCVTDKRRHARFGADYVQHLAAQWDDADRSRISEYLSDYIYGIELKGYQCASLASVKYTGDIVQADAVCASAGLGALDAQEERRVFAASLLQLTEQLRAHGIALAPLEEATELLSPGNAS